MLYNAISVPNLSENRLYIPSANEFHLLSSPSHVLRLLNTFHSLANMPQFDGAPEGLRHVSQPQFWLLALFILAFWIFSAVLPPAATQIQPPRPMVCKAHFPIRFTTRIQPYPINSSRRGLCILNHIAILVIQLIEGRRILEIALCLTGMFFA